MNSEQKAFLIGLGMFLSALLIGIFMKAESSTLIYQIVIK